ncbi:MAG: zf-HC2 domain-containing protein [Myxococcota bacterium]
MAHDTTNGARRARCPEDVLAWIPWYADGGLTAREKGAVEAHAAQCGDCRAELDVVAGAPWAFEGVELPDADRLFAEITARIEAEEREERATVIPISRGRALSEADLARLEQWVRDPESEREAAEVEPAGAAASVPSGPVAVLPAAVPTSSAAEAARSVRGPIRRFGATAPLWAAAAAAALLLFFAGARSGTFVARPFLGLGGSGEETAEDTDYQLASADAAASSGGAPAIDVVFHDAASMREISTTLRSLGVEIVSGPTNLGVYRLRLQPAATEGRAPTAADAAAIAARLAAPDASLAIFAEPVP